MKNYLDDEFSKSKEKQRRKTRQKGINLQSRPLVYFTTKFFADISVVELYLMYTHVNQRSRPGPVFCDTINSRKWAYDS